MSPTNPPINKSVLRLLSLSPSTCTLKPLSGGCSSARAFRLSTTSPPANSPSSYFLKTAQAKSATVMFRGEHESLNAINSAVNTLCPRSYGWGELEDGDGAFLITEFLDLSGRSRGGVNDSDSGSASMTLAQKMAVLHTTPAPLVPATDSGGHGGKQMFGFPVPTCCGDTPQANGWKDGWADFFAEERLLFILQRCEDAQGPNKELRRVVEEVVKVIVPRLLGEGHLGGTEGVKPVVVHGDLWSGNHGVGTLGEKGGREEVVYDPSACYAHSEYELGIMGMFGGFGKGFWEEYHKLVPKTAPVGEYEDRVELYRSYHYLNHYALFGGRYHGSAVNILERLLKKYGET